MADAPSTACAQ